MLPLPLQRYEMAHFKTVRIHIDYHVEVERHRYSVQQLDRRGMSALNFEECVAPLIDREAHARNDRKLVRLPKKAHFK